MVRVCTRPHPNSTRLRCVYWEPSNGNRLRSTFDDLEADTQWDEWSCLLGFPVMGIWPEGCNGLDVNAVSMAELPGGWRFVVTSDDDGKVKLFMALDDAGALAKCKLPKADA